MVCRKVNNQGTVYTFLQQQQQQQEGIARPGGYIDSFQSDFNFQMFFTNMKTEINITSERTIWSIDEI